jgi:ABC-2 type transport system ATP-binding protein
MDDAVVRTKKLVKRFGRDIAVYNLTFDVPRGTIFGFVGPSGCGKTTTIRLLTGFYRPTSGSALVLGQESTTFRATERGRIGYMPQQFVLYPNLTVWENLNFAGSIYGVDLRREDQLRQLLDLVELTDHRSKLTRNLSGGMQRRLSLAATLVHDPELIFLDEPTAGVDPLLRHKFWEYFRYLREQETTLFVTTQYVAEAAYCDIVGLLVNGQLLALGTPEALRRRAFGGDTLDLRTARRLDSRILERMRRFPFVSEVTRTGEDHLRVVVTEASTALPTLVEWCEEQGVGVKAVQEYLPPFDDVFVQLVEKEAR